MTKAQSNISPARAEALTDAMTNHGETEAGLRARYVNQLGYREALHLSFVMAETVDHYLRKHPAIILDQEAYELATSAVEALFDLYQRLGTLEHENV